MPAGGAGGEDRAGQRAQLRSVHAVLQEQKLQQPAVRAKDRAALSQARYRSPGLAIAAACPLIPILLGPRIREVFPKAEISVISGSPEWNAALAKHALVADLHFYLQATQYGVVPMLHLRFFEKTDAADVATNYGAVETGPAQA